MCLQFLEKSGEKNISGQKWEPCRQLLQFVEHEFWIEFLDSVHVQAVNIGFGKFLSDLVNSSPQKCRSRVKCDQLLNSCWGECFVLTSITLYTTAQKNAQGPEHLRTDRLQTPISLSHSVRKTCLHSFTDPPPLKKKSTAHTPLSRSLQPSFPFHSLCELNTSFDVASTLSSPLLILRSVAPRTKFWIHIWVLDQGLLSSGCCTCVVHPTNASDYIVCYDRGQALDNIVDQGFLLSGCCTCVVHPTHCKWLHCLLWQRSSIGQHCGYYHQNGFIAAVVVAVRYSLSNTPELRVWCHFWPHCWKLAVSHPVVVVVMVIVDTWPFSSENQLHWFWVPFQVSSSEGNGSWNKEALLLSPVYGDHPNLASCCSLRELYVRDTTLVISTQVPVIWHLSLQHDKPQTALNWITETNW